MADEAQALSLVPGRTDRELAEDLRARLKAALAPICALMDEAAAAGLHLGFKVERNAIGKAHVAGVEVMRPL